MRKTAWMWLAGSALAFGIAGHAVAVEGGHTIATPGQFTWQPGPPALPAGAKIAVLQGDPTASSGTFTMRVRFPAGYRVPPHSHPTDEDLTVIGGGLVYGMDPRADKSKAATLPPGSFVALPAKAAHQVWAGEQGVELQVHGTSPFDVVYLDPADDPRNKQAQTPPPR